MKKRKDFDPRIVLLFFFFVVVFLFSYLSLFSLPYTGLVTGTGTATVTQAGAAGLLITDTAIAFGSGYYNATCTGNTFATLDSNLTYGDGTVGSVYGQAAPYCWVNTTAILDGTGRDFHTLQNNGSAFVNVSVIADKHAEDWLCGGNCPFTNVAALQYLSYNNESNSCTGLSSGYEQGVSFNSNVTIGICDRLDFQDSSDSINVFVNASVAKDASSGAKTISLAYETLAY
ncbi:MAG: hypothetical protein Q8R18_01775 [bacterium]|nr:hypothetical protein [bacterium]